MSIPSLDGPAKVFHNPLFPRASRYSDAWIAQHEMGPNVLQLTEWLCQHLQLEPGMRVLDLGCGCALSSIFLAREFGLSVVAADLWIAPGANWQRVCAAGMKNQVTPLRADARQLPFAEGYFDAIISIDAYQYFGTDALYLGYLTRFLGPGGQLGCVLPSMTQVIDELPRHLTQPQSNGATFWEPDCVSFLAPEEWRRLWQRPGIVDLERVELVPEGWRLWAEHEEAMTQLKANLFPSSAEALRQDAGQTIGLLELVARRPEQAIVDTLPHFSQPTFSALAGQLLSDRKQRLES